LRSERIFIPLLDAVVGMVRCAQISLFAGLLFQPDLRPVDDSLAFDLGRAILGGICASKSRIIN
jgi:hypothetical protein